MDNETLQSKTITFLRFPLIVGVVLIHSQFNEVVVDGTNLMQDGSFPVYTTASYLFSDIIAGIAVPLFFFISGFLFFYKTPSFTAKVYGSKLKKRLKTILVPYVFWNLLTIALFFLSELFFPDLMSGKNKLICDYSFLDWLRAFWDIINGCPICYQLWFIRDLMVIMLFSPLVYVLLKQLRQYTVIGLGLLWLFDFWFTLTGFSIEALFFFSAGAYFSVYRKNFVSLMRLLLPVTAILYPLIAIAILCFRDQTWCYYLSQISILIGIVLAVGLSSHFLEKGTFRVNRFLSDSSFFIYAYHGLVLVFITKTFFKILQPHSDAMLLALYVARPLLVITGGLVIYFLLKKYLPRITEIITGGR